MDITHILFSTIAAAFTRLVFEFRDARRRQRELAELSAMDANAPRDAGVSRVAAVTGTRCQACCI